MKRRIAQQLLKMHQVRTVNTPHPLSTRLSTLSYSLIGDMVMDIKRPFRKICIHGREPHLMLPYIADHNKKWGENNYTITLVDYVRCEEMQKLIEKQPKVKQIRYIQNGDGWLGEQNVYDLLLSSLRVHHANDPQSLFTKYERTLQPDGALIGTAYVEGTLRELYWSYLVAENQRYGGVSPKVGHFPGLGQTGSYLTSSKYELCTILQHQETLEFESFVDVLTVLQQMGETGWLRGRRKAVFEDMLLAAGALYQSEFRTQRDTVKASFAMSKFIGWKHHKSQPKKLRPGKQVGSMQFSDQLRKYGEVEDYMISEDSENPQRTK